MAAIENDIATINAALRDVGDQLKRTAEESAREIKNHARMSEETKAAADKLLAEQSELRARLQSAEQLLAKMESGAIQSRRFSNMGELVSRDESVRAFAKAGRRGSVTIDVQAAITSVDGSGGALIQPTRVPGIVSPMDRRLTVIDLLARGVTNSNSIEYVRETGFTNAAAPVAEAPVSPKPESDIDFTLLSAPVVTIAHWVHASRQVLQDAGMLESYINNRLRYGLELVKEAQVLNGTGSGVNMLGLVPQAADYANPGVLVAGETAIDRIRIAMLQVALAEYSADGIVLNPIDWAQIELSKDLENRYLIANPQGITSPPLWGVPVVTTTAMPAGQFLTGAFKLGAQYWDREQTTVTVSTEDRDNFVRNMVTILAESRGALTVYRPEAFVVGNVAEVEEPGGGEDE